MGAGKSPNCPESQAPYYKMGMTMLSALPTFLGCSVEQTKEFARQESIIQMSAIKPSGEMS